MVPTLAAQPPLSNKPHHIGPGPRGGDGRGPRCSHNLKPAAPRKTTQAGAEGQPSAPALH